MTTESIDQATTVTWESVLDELRERRSEFHALRYVPRDFVDKLIALGVYRAAAPARFGGEPMSPAEFIRTVERISRVDGSTGWVVAFSTALTYLGALPLETQAEIYRDGPDVVFAGGLFPLVPAEETDAGFLVNGTWKFASGCMAADWIGVGLVDPEGGGLPRVAVLPADQVEITDNWNVDGMVASGSFDTKVHDVEVAREWTFLRGSATNIDEPLYRYPPIGFQAQMHASIGLGVAQAALDQVRQAGSRRGVTGAPPQGARAYFRIDVAKAYVRLNAARSFFIETADRVWASVCAGDEVTPQQIADIRLSAVYVADVAAQTVHDIAAVSGSGIISDGHPLQVIRRDAQVPQLHATLSHAMYDAGGAVLLGQQPDIPFS
ncbi:acyl-CoA dehydrogenase family protein [Microbacterium gorillae]|uniref:acyl-CoA dehydrogenase family protein n=1 Tax=Microbacterium gorillae TaxID=1231063 RepID=UPI00059057A7|nr:acyl-CoA dehydrogenase family protein [Microbacterium gorillae]